MKIVYPVCCGIDVHQAQVTACLRKAAKEGSKVSMEIREFSTTKSSLEESRGASSLAQRE